MPRHTHRASGLLIVALAACNVGVGDVPAHGLDATAAHDAPDPDGSPDARSEGWISFFVQPSASPLASGTCGGMSSQTSRGYTRYWQDDFRHGASLPDSYFEISNNLTRINSEQQHYEPSGVTVDSQGAHLRARRVAPFVAADGLTYAYTSGELYTSNRGSGAFPSYQQHGRWEVCASLPTARGSWPAIWLLRNAPAAAPGNVPWPPEIDVMEHVGDLAEIQTNLFWGPSASPQSAEQRHPDVPAGGVTGFHLYAVELDANTIDYFVDGVLIRRYATAANIPAGDMFLVLDLAVGGVLPSYRPPCDGPTPGTNVQCADGVAAYDSGVEMVVSYVRAYR